MENIEIHIEGTKLHITVDLSHEGHISRTGRSRVLATTRGNLSLWEGNRFRPERINLTVFKPAPDPDDPLQEGRGRTGEDMV